MNALSLCSNLLYNNNYNKHYNNLKKNSKKNFFLYYNKYCYTFQKNTLYRLQFTQYFMKGAKKIVTFLHMLVHFAPIFSYYKVQTLLFYRHSALSIFFDKKLRRTRGIARTP